MASLQDRLLALINSIGSDIKSLQSATFTGAAWTEEVRASNYVNSTATGSDIFTGFAPGANKKYLIEAFLACSTPASSNGSQFALLVPTGMTATAAKIVAPMTATTERVDNVAAGTYSGATTGVASTTLSTVVGLVLVGAAPGGGNIRIGGRSETILTNGLICYPPSVMRWRELP